MRKIFHLMAWVAPWIVAIPLSHAISPTSGFTLRFKGSSESAPLRELRSTVYSSGRQEYLLNTSSTEAIPSNPRANVCTDFIYRLDPIEEWNKLIKFIGSTNTPSTASSGEEVLNLDIMSHFANEYTAVRGNDLRHTKSRRRPFTLSDLKTEGGWILAGSLSTAVGADLLNHLEITASASIFLAVTAGITALRMFVKRHDLPAITTIPMYTDSWISEYAHKFLGVLNQYSFSESEKEFKKVESDFIQNELKEYFSTDLKIPSNVSGSEELHLDLDKIYPGEVYEPGWYENLLLYLNMRNYALSLVYSKFSDHHTTSLPSWVLSTSDPTQLEDAVISLNEAFRFQRYQQYSAVQ